MDDVRRAVTEINQQAHLLAVRDAAPQEKLLLLAICNEIYQSGRVRSVVWPAGGGARKSKQ